nr:sulfite exporter TauE/SafE family protein [Saprospiraceae bacterium]
MIGEIIIAGMLMGLASGLHCLGMCGPLVASFPPTGINQPVWMDPYHPARIAVYGLLGVFSGILGTLVSFAGLHLFAGFVFLLLLITALLFVFKKNLNPGFTSHSFFTGWWIKGLSKGGFTARVSLGAINGLLPCGMVYFALATSMAWGSISGSVTYMVAFGLGTLPFLLMIPILGKMIPVASRRKLKPLQPILFLASILLVLWRVVIAPMELHLLLPWMDSATMCS